MNGKAPQLRGFFVGFPTLRAMQGRLEWASIRFIVTQPWLQADALIDLAEILLGGGRVPEATGAVQDALRLYERKGIVPYAARARALVAELRSAAA